MMLALCPACNEYKLFGRGKMMWCLACNWKVDFDPLEPIWAMAEERRRAAGRTVPDLTDDGETG